MTVSHRMYTPDVDFSRVKIFLAETFFHIPPYQMWIPTRFENSVFYNRQNTQNIQLWFEKNQLVGLVVLDLPGNITTVLHQNYKSHLPDLISWAEDQVEKNVPTKDAPLFTYALEDNNEQNTLLASLGYTPLSVCEHTHTRDPSQRLPFCSIPDGFIVKPIYPNYYDQYVHAIEIVFKHNLFTHSVFSAMRQTNFYHEDLLIGAFREDDSLAAFAMVRIDEYKIAEFEPVGTLPEFRRKGLARALMREGITRTQKYHPKIFYVGGAPTDEADGLYRSMGFVKHRNMVRWSKERKNT